MSSRDALVRIGVPGGPIAGMGVLVGERQVVTCAHVVNAALGRGHRSQQRPDRETTLQLVFPLVPGEPVRSATVVAWEPPLPSEFGGDVAGLLLNEDAPPVCKPVRFAPNPPANQELLQAFGY